jgi:hypothetical protein
MPGPCSEKSASPREGKGHRRRRRSAVGNTWAGWGSIPVVFPPGMAGHPCLIHERRPFPSKEKRRISERDDLGPPVVSGGQEIVWDPETSILAHGEGL